MKDFFKRLWRSWFPQYKLYVTHRGIEHEIHVKDFKKRSPKKISGVDINGSEFEIISVEPMEYFIVEYTDDLKKKEKNNE